ncbi:MAG: type II toxin-antitoxin system death-on-curing family toxin [Chloroflexota bacterium]
MTVSAKTTPGRRQLSDAENQPTYVYVDLAEALALYAEIKGLSLAETQDELRDENLLQSALARPENAAHYANADLAEQAASLLCGIAQNQPFIDGNKRISLVVTLTFLELNGHVVDFSEDELYQLMIDISAGMTVVEVAGRLRNRLTPSG